MWLALVTITTVGYGDIELSTTLGRFVASALMFVGLGLVASVTAIVSVKFIQNFVDHHTNDDVLEKLDDMQKDLDEIKKKFNKDYFHLYNLKFYQVNRFHLIHSLLIFFVNH